MTHDEIFKRLMVYKSRALFTDDADEEYFCAVLYDVAKVLDLSQEQADTLAELEANSESVQESTEETLPDVNPSEYEITDGYIGSFGVSFATATNETFVATVEAAASFAGIDTKDVIDRLLDGQPVRWRRSPNYTYDHSFGVIRRKQATAQVYMVHCSCGHSVPSQQVMNTSSGTACSECYDRTSG